MAPSAADLTPPTRIPKLKYRNPLPPDQLPIPPRNPARKTSPPASDTASTLSHSSFETASLTSSSLASTYSSNGSSSDSASATKKKKKGSSVFGFLSLKEPSQVALEQYAEQQRKQGPLRGNSSSASSIKANSINSKKLPATVPKVTSKWDGIPSSIKNRNSTSNRSSSDSYRVPSRDSKSSYPMSRRHTDSRISVMTQASQNPPNSIASHAPSMVDVSMHEPTHYAPSSPSTAAPPDVPYYAPSEPIASVAAYTSSSVSLPGAIAGPPPSLPRSRASFERPSFERSSFERPSFERGSFETIREDYAGARAPSPALSTDSADTIVRDTADAIFKKLNDGPQQSYLGGNPAAVQSPERSTYDYDQEEGGVPESHDFLFDVPPTTEQPPSDTPMASPPVPPYSPRRPIQNFSRLMHTPDNAMPPPPPRVSAPSALRLKPASPGLPTLYEGSVASTESLDTVRDNSDAHSIAASSVAASELSEQWFQNPRDRLGLGGRLRKGDAPRWKSIDEPPGKPRKNLLSFLVRSRS